MLLAFEWQLLVDAQRLCPGIGTDFLTINPDFVKRLYRNKGGIRPNDMYLPFDPGRYGDSFPKAIAAAGGEWWGPYIADVTAQDIHLAHELGVMVNVWGVDSNDEAIEQALLLEADAITLSDSTMLQRRLNVPQRDLPDHR